MAVLQTDGIAIYYEEEGAGEPVVLIGGLTSTVEVWELQRRALAQAYRVVLPDNRGSGRTRVAADDGSRSIRRFAADVLALLDGLGLERVHLVGASMGGMIVQQFAVDHPERLRSLIIACSHCGGAAAVQPPPEAATRLVSGSSAGAGADAERAGLEVVFHPDSFERRREAVELYQRTKKAWPHPPHEVARRALAVRDFDVSERLRDLRVPTLVICGADDAIIPAENSRELARRIPGAELVVIPAAGHVFFVEEPDATNRALLEFLARCPRERTP